MKYQVVREEYGKTITLMQCDFEDKNQFRLIAQNSQHKILCNEKDVTHMYGNEIKQKARKIKT